ASKTDAGQATPAPHRLRWRAALRARNSSARCAYAIAEEMKYRRQSGHGRSGAAGLPGASATARHVWSFVLSTQAPSLSFQISFHAVRRWRISPATARAAFTIF